MRVCVSVCDVVVVVVCVCGCVCVCVCLCVCVCAWCTYTHCMACPRDLTSRTSAALPHSPSSLSGSQHSSAGGGASIWRTWLGLHAGAGAGGIDPCSIWLKAHGIRAAQLFPDSPPHVSILTRRMRHMAWDIFHIGGALGKWRHLAYHEDLELVGAD